MLLQELLTLNEISFSDPDRDVGAIDREGRARAALADREKEAYENWNILAQKLNAKNVNNRLSRNFSDSSHISMTISDKFSISMFRSDVTLSMPPQNKDGRAVIKHIFKKHGIDLYDMNFYLADKPNTYDQVRIGYYSSLSGPNAEKYMRAIEQVVNEL